MKLKEKDIRDECGHIADTRHETGDHVPSKFATMGGGWLMDDRADAVCFHYTPNEKGDPSDRHYCCFYSEKMSAIV